MNNRAMAGLAVALMMGSMGVGAAEMAAADASKEKPAAVEAAVFPSRRRSRTLTTKRAW